MKKKLSKNRFMLTLLMLLAATVIFAKIIPMHSLIGRWSILNTDGTPTQEYVNFKMDSTYEVTLPNGQVGERGYYLLKDSTFTIKNAKDVCGKDYWGAYCLTFQGEDSVHFALIRDTCTERRMDIVGYNPWIRRIVTK